MENHPPARKVVTRAPWRTVRLLNMPGLFPAPVECESSLERDFVYRAALCPWIADLRHQPLRLELPEGRWYTPDFLVRHTDDSTCLVEVKPLSKVDRNAAMFDQAASALRGQGFGFLVLTEREIRRNRAHERASYILRHRKSVFGADESRRVVDLLSGAQSGSLDIAALCLRAQVSVGCVLHLLASRRLVASRVHEIHTGACVAAVNGKDTHHAVHVHEWFDAQEWSAHTGADTSTQRDGASVRGRADPASEDAQDCRSAQASLERALSGCAGRGFADEKRERRAASYLVA